MNQSMPLANMRENGVYSVIATCGDCGHKSNENVDALPETTMVPEAGLRLRFSSRAGPASRAREHWLVARG
jgi:hypothetical protein